MNKKEGFDMLTYWGGSDAAVVVIHEIYGLNQHIKGFCKKLYGQGTDVFAPDLLNRHMPFSYREEEAAHRYFIHCVGFERATEQVKGLLYRIRSRYKKVFIVGFSVGATVAWLVSRDKLCDAVVGFYGSRIRDHLYVNPVCPVLLFFPDREKSYDVDELIVVLNCKNNVSIMKFNAGHGFADPFSKSYCRESFDRACGEMLALISYPGNLSCQNTESRSQNPE
ncbi:MAG: dienelactone hydrolase family protein [Bacillota bacterium]